MKFILQVTKNQFVGMYELFGVCCDGVGDVDAGQAAAAAERIVADCSDGVGRAVVSYGLGDGYVTRIIALVRIIYILLVSYNGIVPVDVIVDAVHHEVVGGCGGWQQEGQQQEDLSNSVHCLIF